MSFLPQEDLNYLDAKEIVFEECVDGKQKGVIIRSWLLPDEMYDAERADVLILIPNGYPDVRPDMFHLTPWVKLRNGNRYPKAADQPVAFNGGNWQRWSRHLDAGQWRSGVDCLQSYLALVQKELRAAAPAVAA